MREQSLMLIGSTPAAHACSVVRLALERWPLAERPRIAPRTFEQVLNDPDALKNCVVAWILLDQPEAAGLYDVMARLQDQQISAVLTRPRETKDMGSPFQDGIIIAPPDADPLAVSAILRTLWNHAGIIRSMSLEMELLRAQTGGMAGQFDKIDEELRLAAQLQHEFLPNKLPHVPRADVRVLYRPAGYVSGDIYDVIRLDDRHIGLFIADAVGHGVPAALMTMYIKRSLHTKQLDPLSPTGYRLVSPDETLSRLNYDMIHQQSDRMRYATAAYGVLDCETMQLQFARAGHPFPMIFRADGSVQCLDVDGGLLGIFPDEKFELATVTLNPGDRIILYTDGFEIALAEASGTKHRKPLSQQMLEHEFIDLAQGSLDDAMQRLTDKLDQHSGSLHQVDDLTAIVVGVKRAVVTASEEAHPAADMTDVVNQVA